MKPGPHDGIPRILVIDDNPGIHRDFEVVLLDEVPNAELEAEEERLFTGRARPVSAKPLYALDHAYSGLEGVEKVRRSVAEDRPYQVAFVDIRMPGIDGVETISRMWEADGRVQVVICTAYSDYSWSDLARRLGTTDKLLVLKKPFDNIEVVQLASTLSEKWTLAVQANLKLEELELLVSQRTRKLVELLRRQDSEAPRAAGSQDAGQGAAAAPELPVLLLVEHDATFAAELGRALSADFRVVSAADAGEGFAQAQESVPDVIVAEIAGPGLDGIAFCRRLKSDELAGHIPVVMLGSAGLEDSHIKALEAGADDCLAKPFTPQLLKARIDHLVRSRRDPRGRLTAGAGQIQPRDLADNQLDAQFLRRVINTIDKHLSDFEFDVDVLAHKMAVSRRQLFRKLKAVTGGTPNTFIRNLRLNRAASLLQQSQMTITEITYAVGFSDLKHFRTVFREHFGVLPGEYAPRRGVREGEE